MKKLIAGLCVVAMSSTVMADYVNDFEAPFSTSDLSASPWSTVAAGSNPAASIQTSTIDTGTNSTEVMYIPGTASVVWNDASAGVTSGVLEFDLLQNGVGTNPVLTFIAGTVGAQAVYISISDTANDGSSDLSIFDTGVGTSSIVIADFMPKDAWANIKIDFDSDIQKYDIAVNGVTVVSNREYWGAVAAFDRVYWATSAYNNQVDNFSLSSAAVPEPASLALFGLAALLIVKPQRRLCRRS